MPPLVTDFEELKLRIDSGVGGDHRVTASSTVGEARGTFALPFSDLELENFVLRVGRPRGRRGVASGAVADAKKFGGTLFDSVFQGEVRDLYHSALVNARSGNRGLRITLCLSGSPALMDVPWEYLFDDPDFLAVSAFTPVVRYLDLPQGFRPLRVDPPLRILGVVSSPSDYDRLDVASEQQKLEGALTGLIGAGSVVVDWLDKPSLSSLLNRLQSDAFHVIHFVGHGGFDAQGEQGVLLFENENGNGRPTSGDELGTVLHDFTSLRLAVLNACEGARSSTTDPFSGVAESLVRRGIPAVVAMQFEITDAAAVEFAAGFYRAIAGGSPVDASLASARLAIFAASSAEIEWGTPVLFMRVPDGQIFDVPEHAARSAAAAPGPVSPAALVPDAAATPASAAAPPPPGPPPAGPPSPRGVHPGPEPAPAAAAASPPVTHGAKKAGRRTVIAVAVICVVIVVAGAIAIATGGSSSKHSSPVTSRGVTTHEATKTVGGNVVETLSGAWIGRTGPLTVTVNEVDLLPKNDTILIHATVTCSFPVTLTVYDNAYFYATDSNGRQYRAATNKGWPIYVGIPAHETILIDKVRPAKSMTITFTGIAWGKTPKPEPTQLEVKDIPLPFS